MRLAHGGTISPLCACRRDRRDVRRRHRERARHCGGAAAAFVARRATEWHEFAVPVLPRAERCTVSRYCGSAPRTASDNSALRARSREGPPVSRTEARPTVGYAGRDSGPARLQRWRSHLARGARRGGLGKHGRDREQPPTGDQAPAAGARRWTEWRDLYRDAPDARIPVCRRRRAWHAQPARVPLETQRAPFRAFVQGRSEPDRLDRDAIRRARHVMASLMPASWNQ